MQQHHPHQGALGARTAGAVDISMLALQVQGLKLRPKQRTSGHEQRSCEQQAAAKRQSHG
jgi:hypothetical protein